jgi:uncharacterized membrane protein
MEPSTFVYRLSDDRIVAAIRQAETFTSGEIRVCISDRSIVDPLAAARSAFEAMKMTETRQRNGVLIFVAPRSRTFAIIGDEGIHARCGESFWQSIAGDMRAHFVAEELTDGIVEAIAKVAELLSKHFPRCDGDQNELPDQVDRGL